MFIKTILLTSLIRLIVIRVDIISAQTGFLDSNYVWTEVLSTPDGLEYYSLKYTVASQAVELNDKEYYEILVAHGESSEDWEGTNEFIRFEDNIVYMPWDSIEIEKYNFNLVVGDTFFDWSPAFVVIEVDSILLENGEWYSRWKLRCVHDDPPYSYEIAEWIEGIGNINGIFSNEDICSHDAEYNSILCLYKNGNLIYDDPENDGCWIITVNTEDARKDAVLISPNPANDYVVISGFAGEIENVTVFDCMGRKIHSGEESRITISGWVPGCFYIYSQSASHEMLQGSFVKQ